MTLIGITVITLFKTVTETLGMRGIKNKKKRNIKLSMN